MSYFSEKNIVITGAAGGLGRGLALEISKEGGQVILLDTKQDKLEELTSQIKLQGGKAFMFVCDLCSKEQIKTTCQNILQQLGHVDILINNAGIVSGKSFLECNDQQIERTFAVNTLAPLWLIRSLLPSMIQRKQGHLVQISSAAGLVGVAQLADYCASKFAVVGLDEAVRYELKKAQVNIATTLVCPYYINTGMFDGVKTKFPLLLPILSQEVVVKKILAAIRHRRIRLIMPWFVYTILPLRILPLSWFDAIVNFFGINQSMEHFKGKVSEHIN